ncbi:MAG TPA: tRNA pseudouridine(38-40) synthase TruA [Candidatus Thermoplasmatota archaeon]|nr:tRNA pseudouridine(38-40) synthase TruA [Candidatus Thermoplasmatota archaeon]
MRFAVKFAYNGAQFSGYARQPRQRTVEQTLLDMLCASKVMRDPKTSCFRTASRTDRRVSALGNVCAFDTERSKEDVKKIIAKIGHPDIYLYGAAVVAPDFYPRHAMRRVYRYYLQKEGLDVDTVLSTAALFTGEHDFSNFARVEPLKNPVRTIDSIVVEVQREFLILDFYAQTFLWNQIRRIVSALKKAGKGTLMFQAIEQALVHPEKRVDFQLAPSEPLILKDVIYDISFECLKNYKKTLQALETAIVTSLSEG